MKKHGLISAAIASTLLLSVISNANAEPVYRYQGDSEYAVVSTSGFKRVYLRVDRVKINTSNTAGITHTTKLYYTAFDPDTGYQYWAGEIGNGDLSGDPSGKMMLNTNTCDYNPTGSCGVVSMTWTNDGTDSTQSSGVTHTETTYYTIRQSGTTKFAVANVSGTVNGVEVNISGSTGSIFGYGRMGSDRSTTLTINNK